jgi:hypothetical protein
MPLLGGFQRFFSNYLIRALNTVRGAAGAKNPGLRTGRQNSQAFLRAKATVGSFSRNHIFQKSPQYCAPFVKLSPNL